MGHFQQIRLRAPVATLFIILAFGLDHVAVKASEDHSPANSAEFVTWPWPIAIPQSSSKEVEKLADELRGQLQPGGAVLRSPINPTCCLWLEITHWQPNPGQSGYVIIIQRGGGVISASNEAQLKLAIDRLKGVARKSADLWVLPVGLLTNYPLSNQEPPKAAKAESKSTDQDEGELIETKRESIRCRPTRARCPHPLRTR